VDGHAHDESMHLRLLSRCFWSGELNAGRRTVMQRSVELTLNPGAGGRSSGDIPELNVILARWWRPLNGADSGGGG